VAAQVARSTVPAGSPGCIVASFVRPVLFSAFGINVYSYGVMVAAALGVAFKVFAGELQRARIKLDEINCFFVFLVGFGIGSKAHLALSAVGAGEELSWKSFDLRTGHSFIGSQVGAVLAMLVYIKRNGVGILPFLDVLLPCCMLGHVIGKGGCFLSGDGCYGPPADPQRVPWAMSFPNALVPTQEPVHPTPIYESICSFIVFAAARGVFPLPPVNEGDEPEPEAAPKFPVAGRRTALVLVLYGFGRVVVEQFRRHPPINLFGGLTEYQFLALVLLLVGAAIEGWSRLQASRGPSAPEAEGKARAKKTD